jgi:hypothetical protein
MPKFSTFHFDICGPCYLRPMRRFRGEKVDPGFVVADVVLGRVLEQDEVKHFIRKCETLSYLRGVRPFLPILIADGFAPEALRACREQGIVATRPETLFGRDVGQALADLMQTLKRAAVVAASDPKRLESLFARLGAIEGAATNLRGALFELLVGHMVRSVEGGSIDIGEIVRDQESNQNREIDAKNARSRSMNAKDISRAPSFRRARSTSGSPTRCPQSIRHTVSSHGSTAPRSGLSSGLAARSIRVR